MNELNKRIRRMAIEVLDDSNGIGAEAWDRLYAVLQDTLNGDIIPLVNSTDDRFYLNEDTAASLRAGN